MRDDDIARLVRLRRIPSEVITRAPGEEVAPDPQPGERVVFGAHFDRGLGLPASPFLRQFLDFFGLQPHHLPANAFVTLSCYVAFMEGYAGLWPDVEFWSRLFYLKTQTADGHMRACGAASIYSRTATPFPKIPTVDSVKKWQMSFFYVRNDNPMFDWVNLPEYNPAPPTARLNWGANHKSANPDAEVNMLWDFLQECVTEGGLCAADLLCCYASRRVLPLQARAHKICHMSGRFDPTRTSKLELTPAQVAKRVNFVSQAKLPDNWNWGMEPYSRKELPPVVSLFLAGCRLAAAWPAFVLTFSCVCSFSPGSRLRTATWSINIGRRITLIRLTKPAMTRARRRLSKPPRGNTIRRRLRTSRGESRSRRRPPQRRFARCLCRRGRLRLRRLPRPRPRGGSGPAIGPPPSWRRS